MMRGRSARCLRFGWLAAGAAGVAACMAVPAIALELPADARAVQMAFALHARYLAEQARAHEHGEGVPRDPGHAAVLYCEAVRLGDAEAAFALGWMYANGRGLPHSDAHASYLFRLAANKGHEHARQMLRFTGEEVAERPECLAPRLADDVATWNGRIEERIRRLSAERQGIARLVIELAPQYQISPVLALAIALTESALDPGAVSPKNAMGVMQLIPDTAARFNVRDAFDPQQNIRGGLAYLRWLLAYFEGDVVLAAAAYNAGERAVERYRGVPPFRETRDYVQRIMSYVERRDHPFDRRVAAPSAMLPEVRIARQESGS